MLPHFLIKEVKEAVGDGTEILAVSLLAVAHAVNNHKIKARKKEFNKMAIKFRKLNKADVSPTTGVEDRGLKVSEYNFLELNNYIFATNVGEKDSVATHHVDANGDTSKHRIKLPTKKGPRVAQVGDVVVRRTVQKVTDSAGLQRYHEYYVIKEADFAGYAK